MYKIDVFQTHIVINDYTIGDSEYLENLLSYYDNIIYEQVTLSFKYIEEEKKLIIPRSISISFLEKEFNHSANFNKYSNAYDKTFFMLKVQPRNDIQRETIAFLLGKDNYFHTQKFSQIGLKLKGGLGKTYCTIAAISEMKMKSAIILHNSALLTQWEKRILEYTDIVKEEICIIAGSSSVKKALKNKSKYKIYLISHKTLSSLTSSEGSESVSDLFKELAIGVKVYDEAHLEFYNIIRTDFATNVYKTIYLTATPARSDKKEDRIYQVYFKDVPFFGKEIENEVKPHIYCNIYKYNSQPDYVVQSKCKTKRGFSIMAYCHYNFTIGRETFLKTLFIPLDLFMKYQGKIIILVSSNARIQELEKEIKLRYPETSVGIFTSIIPKADREKELESKIILSTSKSLATGNDIYDATFMINTEAFSSSTLTGQVPFRLRPIDGRKVMYTEIVDIGFESCRRQLKERLKVYQKECKQIRVVDI